MHRKKYQLITKLYAKQIFIVFNLLYTQYYDCIMLYILQWHETEEQQSHQKNWLPQYNWNIVESGVKHLPLI
jgi:hypothetical protein